MGQKIIVSKATFNALTETDPRNLIFSSDLNSLKTAGSGTIQKTLSGNSSTSETVAHGLSISPLVLGYFRNTANSNWFIIMSQPAAEILSRPLIDLNVSVEVDTTNLKFYFFNDNASSRTIELQYEFFYEGN
jgi:hypothetical protein